MGILMGSDRLLWDYEVLLSNDHVLAKLEFEFRTEILSACVEIIEKYG